MILKVDNIENTNNNVTVPPIFVDNHVKEIFQIIHKSHKSRVWY